MTSKERVFAALRHTDPDRVPRFIWLGGETYRRLTKKYGITPLELDLKFGNDVLQTWVSINGEMERDVLQGTEFTDSFGVRWKRDGEYNMVVRHPLAGCSASEIRAWSPPDPHASERYERLDYLLTNYGSEYFIGADVSGTLFEPAYHLRGMENLMLDLAEGNEEVELILNKLRDFSAAAALECVRRGADWIWLGDDLGSQQGMLMSPDMWRVYFKPRMKTIIDAVRKAKPRMPIAYHSCGSMAPVISDLIELGIDVVNPLQESAIGMDQKAVKRAFGDRLTLMCGLDTQQFMPRATPDEVFRMTKEKVDTLGTSGGYIFAVSHHIQGDVSDENIDAMLRALDG